MTRAAEATTTGTQTQFLLERLAEDETSALAAVARNGLRWTTHALLPGSDGLGIRGEVDGGHPLSFDGDFEVWDDEGAVGMYAETARHVVGHDPARVLADVAAKRAIVELHLQDGSRPWCRAGCGVSTGVVEWPCHTVRALAGAYADHPDFGPSSER